MPKEDRPIVLYPAYFDVGRSRHEGRRVAKRWAVESPTTQEVASAAKALGLEPRVEDGRRSPRRRGGKTAGSSSAPTTTRRQLCRRSRSTSRSPANGISIESSMVLRGPDIFDEALAGRHQVDGMDHRAHLPQGLLHARVGDPRALDRNLDAISLLIDFVEG